MAKPAKLLRPAARATPRSPACEHYIVMHEASRAATQKAAGMIRDLRRFALPLLADWTKCYVELPGQPTPRSLAAARRAVSGDGVPTVQDLRLALIEQFETELGTIQAWNVLSPEDRKGLTPPGRVK